MKISERDKKLLYFLAIFVVLAAAFFFGYQKMTEKTLEYENKYIELNRTYNDLHIKSLKLEKYIADTIANKALYDNALEKFAAGNTQEYIIMFLAGVEDKTGLWLSQTSLNEPIAIYRLGEMASTNPSPTKYTLPSDLQGYKTTMSLTYDGTYDQVKAFVEYIENYKERYSIDSISFSYKMEEKKLNGTIQLSQYALIGSREFNNVTVPTVPTGTENIFSSSTFNGGMGSLEETGGARIIYDYDMYMILSPNTSDIDSVIMGIKDSEESVISNNSNKTENVTVKVTGTKGNYRVQYQIGDITYPAANYAMGVEYDPGNTLDLLIISSKRTGAEDLSGAKVTIINETDMVLNTKVVGDDEYSPRYISYDKQGNIKSY